MMTLLQKPLRFVRIFVCSPFRPPSCLPLSDSFLEASVILCVIAIFAASGARGVARGGDESANCLIYGFTS